MRLFQQGKSSAASARPLPTGCGTMSGDAGSGSFDHSNDARSGHDRWRRHQRDKMTQHPRKTGVSFLRPALGAGHAADHPQPAALRRDRSTPFSFLPAGSIGHLDPGRVGGRVFPGPGDPEAPAARRPGAHSDDHQHDPGSGDSRESPIGTFPSGSGYSRRNGLLSL